MQWLPLELVPFDLEVWKETLFYMIIGITFAVLTRREEITLPSRVGRKIKPGTLGQYIIIACLSFFFQRFGFNPIASGLYAGTGGTIGNQLQKVASVRMAQADMEERLKEMMDDFEQYKEYTESLEQTREKKILEMIAKAKHESIEDIEKDIAEKDTKQEVIPIVKAVLEVVAPPEVREKMEAVELSFKAARELLKRARKKMK